jgi:hypothetical protein
MFAGLVQSLRSASAAPVAVGAAVIAFAIPAAACGSIAAPANHSPAPKVVVVHDNANGRTLSLRAGDSLELILSSSYWNVTGSSSARVLQQVGATVLMPRPSSCPTIPGLGCTPERTNFKALTSGKAVISASRTTCGEALACGSGRATSFTLTVLVTPAS